MSFITRIFVVLFLVFSVGANGYGQTTGKKKMKKEPSKMEKGTSNIGFGANIGNIRFYNNAFQFGIAPNIAYRFGESFAVGFMLKMDYYYQRYPSYDLKFSAFDLGPTVFARWKPLFTMDNATPFLQGLFLQAEYERASIAREAFDTNGDPILNDKGTRIEAFRKGEDYLYVGIGAASGYPFSTFISLHYNVIDNSELSRIPFNYRIGFTYNY